MSDTLSDDFPVHWVAHKKLKDDLWIVICDLHGEFENVEGSCPECMKNKEHDNA